MQATDPDTGATLLLRRVEIRLFEKTARWREDNWALDQFARDSLGGCHRRDLSEAMDNRDPISVPDGLAALRGSRAWKAKGGLVRVRDVIGSQQRAAVVRASLRAAHGKEAEAEVSGYYLADEIAAEYRTLAKYLPAEKWQGWRKLGAKEMASLLTEIARQVNMAELHRNQRGPKKPPDKKPVYSRKHKHFSTYRLIE